jgi:hypothetical protein
MLRTRDSWGEIYLFHFDRPLGNLANPRAQARHYLGWAYDAEERIATQLAGRGAAIVRAALAAGITLTPYVLGPAPLGTEVYIKRHIKQTACLCPDCCAARGRRRRSLPLLVAQLELDLEPFPWELPEYQPPPDRPDWMETTYRQRVARAGYASGPRIDLDALEV